jgi:hypothetical protein
MKKSKMPKTDSIQELADFWDQHDLADFEGELTEVNEEVFKRSSGGSTIRVPLGVREAKAVERLAKAKGISSEDLVRTWVKEKLGERENRKAG